MTFRDVPKTWPPSLEMNSSMPDMSAFDITSSYDSTPDSTFCGPSEKVDAPDSTNSPEVIIYGSRQMNNLDESSETSLQALFAPEINTNGQSSEWAFPSNKHSNFDPLDDVHEPNVANDHELVLPHFGADPVDLTSNASYATQPDTTDSDGSYDASQNPILLDVFSLGGSCYQTDQLSEWSDVPGLNRLTITGDSQPATQAQDPVHSMVYRSRSRKIYQDAHDQYGSSLNSIPDSDGSTSRGLTTANTTLRLAKSDTLPCDQPVPAKRNRVGTMSLESLGSQPTKTEVDTWVDRYIARCRKLCNKYLCPACHKVTRGPSALKTHLYHRYRVPAFECDMKCGGSFATKANMQRHAKNCSGTSKRATSGSRVPRCGGKEDEEADD